MDLEQFYEADPRRRHSEELEFGLEWQDGGIRTAVSWVEATGEIYAMRDPLGHLNSDIFGDMSVSPMDNEQLGVRVLGIVQGRAAIEAVMSGWEQAMGNGAESVSWVRDRVAHADSEMADPPGTPSHDLPAD